LAHRRLSIVATSNKDLPLVGSIRGLVALVFTLACLTVALVWRSLEVDRDDRTPEKPSAGKRWDLKVKPLPEPQAPAAEPAGDPASPVAIIAPPPPAAAPTPADNEPAAPIPPPLPDPGPAAPPKEKSARTLYDTPGAQIVGGDWGIVGRIRLQGTPPPERELPLDPACGKFHAQKPTTHLYSVGTNQGLADVFVQIKGLSGRPPLAPLQPVLLDQRGCEYVPYVLAVQTGQPIVVRNSDPFMHNVHPTPTAMGNREENKAQLANGPDLTFSYPAAEQFLRFKCDVHPWMFAYVCVADHPYFGVSDRDGNYHLPKLPPGYYVISAAHRKSGEQTRTIRILPGKMATEDFTFEVK
jgi:hypothetical protein